MKHIYEGKTKTVYALEDGNYLLKFKDDVTGENGVFDPGSNSVGLSIEGMGKGGLRMTEFFFKKIQEAGIPTHFISANIDKAELVVVPAVTFGKGLEVICRYRAVGSFFRRYGDYVKEGQELDALVEVTLKDDNRGDPLITKDALNEVGLLTLEEYDILKNLTKRIAAIVKCELAKKDMELYDIKFEFARNKQGELMLIDEISGGNMRAYKNCKIVEPLDLVKFILE